MEKSLKQKTVYGFLWSTTENFSVQGIQFILGIILARLLSPSDYGMMGMIAIFIAVSHIFVDSGFSTALIQKRDRTDIDFSTVLLINILIAVLLYFILFLAAPYIAIFYKTTELKQITRIVGLNIIINSFALVHRTRFTVFLDFKTQAKASFTSVLIGGVVGIMMAYKGCGVWSLITQSLVRNGLYTIFLWSVTKWKPRIAISIDSLKSMFKFSSHLLAASLIYQIFENIYLIIIGKYYNAVNLGYYVKAKNLASLPSISITSIVQRVTLPVLSELQNDEQRLLISFRKLIRITSLIIFPLFILLFVMAQPMVIVLLTEKWKDSIVILQLLCFGFMWFPMNELNVNLMKALGNSKMVLNLEIIKKTVTVLLLIFTIPFGLKYIVIGQFISSFITFLISVYYTNKITNYNFKLQLKDIYPFLLLALFCGVILLLFMNYISDYLMKLLVFIPLYFTLYLLLSWTFFKTDILELDVLLKNKLNKAENG